MHAGGQEFDPPRLHQFMQVGIGKKPKWRANMQALVWMLALSFMPACSLTIRMMKPCVMISQDMTHTRRYRVLASISTFDMCLGIDCGESHDRNIPALFTIDRASSN